MEGGGNEKRGENRGCSQRGTGRLLAMKFIFQLAVGNAVAVYLVGWYLAEATVRSAMSLLIR